MKKIKLFLWNAINLISNKKWVTLVELLIVVSLLASIPIIWLYFYTWNIKDSRDVYRIDQINNIYDSMMYYKNNDVLPLPDKYVEVRVNWELIAYQWYIWESTLSKIQYRWKFESIKDPKDYRNYSYYLTKDKKYFQLMTFLENKWNSYFEKVNAMYEDRTPYVVWNKLWIITQKYTNIPLQELVNIRENWFIDFTSTLFGEYNLNITNKVSFSSIDNVTIWNKLIELAKLWDSKLLSNWTWIACWWEITDENWISNAITQVDFLNWHRSDDPDVCTWTCKIWYEWSNVTWKCEPDCITLQTISWYTYSNNLAVFWNIFWENAWNWLLDWQISIPWDLWNDELRIDWVYHPYRLIWKIFFQNIWWITFDSSGSDQPRLCKYDEDIYVLKWSAWSQNAWWINFDWKWSIDFLNIYDTSVYYKKSNWKFYWYAWWENIWWIDMNELNLILN